MKDKLKSCPFCGDKMKLCPSVMNKINQLDGVRHIKTNNDCPVGVGVYKLKAWNTRTEPKIKPRACNCDRCTGHGIEK